MTRGYSRKRLLIGSSGSEAVFQSFDSHHRLGQDYRGLPNKTFVAAEQEFLQTKYHCHCSTNSAALSQNCSNIESEW